MSEPPLFYNNFFPPPPIFTLFGVKVYYRGNTTTSVHLDSSTIYFPKFLMPFINHLNTPQKYRKNRAFFISGLKKFINTFYYYQYNFVF